MINKCIAVVDKIINIISFLILIILILIGLYALYDYHHIYESTELTEELKELKPTKEQEKLSYEELKKINGDIIAWITIDDTRIDYPILQGKDNTTYLTVDYNKQYSSAGSIFLDYRNDDSFTDDYSIIYGHNMYYKGMFSDIRNYSDKDYFDNHLTGSLFLKSGKYEIEVIAYSIINAFDDIPYNLMIYQNNKNDEIIKYFLEKAKYKKESNINRDDKILLLSTCSTTATEERMVLFTRIINYEDYIIESE